MVEQSRLLSKTGLLRQIKQRISGFALESDFKMDIGSPRFIDFAGPANSLTSSDILIGLDETLIEVGIDGCIIRDMADNNRFAKIL